MMDNDPARLPSDDAAREAALVLAGYTVSSRGRCMTRIGAAFVMRDDARQCVRVPVATTDAVALGAIWADFSRPAHEMGHRSDTSDTAWRGTVHSKDAALVL